MRYFIEKRDYLDWSDPPDLYAGKVEKSCMGDVLVVGGEPMGVLVNYVEITQTNYEALKLQIDRFNRLAQETARLATEQDQLWSLLWGALWAIACQQDQITIAKTHEHKPKQYSFRYWE